MKNNRGPELLGVDIAFGATAVLANGLRCFVRLKMVKAFGTDDYLMTAATIFFIAYCTAGSMGVHYGTGQHHDDLPLENIRRAKHNWWLASLLYSISMIFSKLSIAFFLLRLSIKKLHTWVIYAASLITVTAALSFFFITMFQCKPVPYFWNKQQSGTCIDMGILIALAYLYSSFCILSDFTFALLPISMVWNLQLRRSSKIALIPLLTMGCIASFAAVARMPHLPKFASDDFLWDTLDIAIWSTIEAGLAITAGSLATLRPLLQSCRRRLGYSSRRSQHPKLSTYKLVSREGNKMPKFKLCPRQKSPYNNGVKSHFSEDMERHVSSGFNPSAFFKSSKKITQKMEQVKETPQVTIEASPPVKVPESVYNTHRLRQQPTDEETSILVSTTFIARHEDGSRGPTPPPK